MMLYIAIKIQNPTSGIVGADSDQQRILVLFDIGVSVILFILLVLITKLDKLKIVQPALILLMIKFYSTALNTDANRINKENGIEVSQLTYQCIWMYYIQKVINSLSSNAIAITMSFSTAVFFTLKLLNISSFATFQEEIEDK